MKTESEPASASALHAVTRRICFRPVPQHPELLPLTSGGHRATRESAEKCALFPLNARVYRSDAEVRRHPVPTLIDNLPGARELQLKNTYLAVDYKVYCMVFLFNVFIFHLPNYITLQVPKLRAFYPCPPGHLPECWKLTKF